MQNCVLEAFLRPVPGASWEIAALLEADWEEKLVQVQELGLVQRTVTLKSGERVGYLERGDKFAKHTLLVLHGMTQDRFSFLDWVAALQTPYGVRVLIPDAMGHGSRTQWALDMGDNFKGWTAEERADDVVEILAAIGDVEGLVDVYGFSMGGATGLSLAAYHPEVVNRVALLSPAVAFTPSIIDETNQGDIRFNFRSIEQAVGFLEVIGFASDLSIKAAPSTAYERARTLVDAKYWARIWLGLLSNIGADAKSMLEDCRKKAELVAKAGKMLAVIKGSVDLVVNQDVPSTIQAAIGGNQCKTILPGYGHVANPTDGTATADAAGPHVAAFLGY